MNDRINCSVTGAIRGEHGFAKQPLDVELPSVPHAAMCQHGFGCRIKTGASGNNFAAFASAPHGCLLSYSHAAANTSSRQTPAMSNSPPKVLDTLVYPDRPAEHHSFARVLRRSLERVAPDADGLDADENAFRVEAVEQVVEALPASPIRSALGTNSLSMNVAFESTALRPSFLMRRTSISCGRDRCKTASCRPSAVCTQTWLWCAPAIESCGPPDRSTSTSCAPSRDNHPLPFRVRLDAGGIEARIGSVTPKQAFSSP